MGKIITIVGNLGAGKTTLTKLLCEKGAFIPYWERPEERPFQLLFANDPQEWAFVNQMEFFMFRCEQELIARKNDQTAVMDGGFDQDYHVFTKHIYYKCYLSEKEFSICERFYRFTRDFLPPPEIIIRINLDIPTLVGRRSSRERKTVDQSFDQEEFIELEKLLDEWLEGDVSAPIIPFSFEQAADVYANDIEKLVLLITEILDEAHPC